jgi:hypothetical protein
VLGVVPSGYCLSTHDRHTCYTVCVLLQATKLLPGAAASNITTPTCCTMTLTRAPAVAPPPLQSTSLSVFATKTILTCPQCPPQQTCAGLGSSFMWLPQPKGSPHGRLHNHFCLDPSPTPTPNHYLHLSVQPITCPQCLHSSPVLALGVVSCGNGSRSSYLRGAATPLRTRGVTQLNSSFIAAADDTAGS